MNNIASYLVANVYQGSNPMMDTFSSSCSVNGQSVPCGPFEGIFAGFGVIWLAIVVICIASMWRIFSKAGKPGWAAIVPIYNVIVLLQVVKKPLWWVVLLFIPIVNVIMSIAVVCYHAKAFNKGIGFTLGLIFLSPIFYPILAFGSSAYAYGDQSQPNQPVPPAQPNQTPPQPTQFVSPTQTVQPAAPVPPSEPVPPSQSIPPAQPGQFVR